LGRLEFIIALAAGLALAAAPARAEEPASVVAPLAVGAMPGTGTIPLDMSGPRPVAMLTLDGGEPVRAIFDTGAAASVLQRDFAEASHLPHQGEGLAAGPGGQPVQGFQTSIHGRLGDVSFPPRLAVAFPIPLPLADVRAIISPQVFSGRLVRIDFAAGQAQVLPRDPAHIPRIRGYDYLGRNDAERITRTPSVEVVLPGRRRLQAMIDTGSTAGLELPLNWATRLRLIGPLQPGPPVRLVGIQHRTFLGQVRGTVRIGELVLRDPEVRFVEDDPGGTVGMAILQHAVIVLDPARSRSWLLPREPERR
jgi:hypothetical protein